jgi:isopropylmalate/homocitrate/citramalate synthase
MPEPAPVMNAAFPRNLSSGLPPARRLSWVHGHTRVLGVQLHTERPVVICDVGPRDGLQNESRALPPQVRAELCNRLARAGLPRVEAVSFVNPDRVPQMAGAEAVIEGLSRDRDTIFAGLILNERGYERALAARVDEVHYAFPATDTFCQRNQGTTLERARELAGRLCDRAHGDGLRITVTIGASFGCPFHNTRNTGYANALAAVEAGVRLLDASCGGTGGCPFAPRATGNIATEDLIYLLHGMGHQTGVDLETVLETAGWLAEALGKELPGQTYRAGAFAPVAA